MKQKGMLSAAAIKDQEFKPVKELSIQDSIEKRGWKITLDRFAGPAVEYLTIDIEEHTSLNIVRNKETRRINSITFLEGKQAKRYSISYLPSELQEYIGYIESHDAPEQNICVLAKADVKELKNNQILIHIAERIRNTRDQRLKEAGINLHDLFMWSTWFFETKE